MDARTFLHLAPAFLRPVLTTLLDRLDAMERRLAKLEARKP